MISIRKKIFAKARNILCPALAFTWTVLLASGCAINNVGDGSHTTDDPKAAVRRLTGEAKFLALDEKDSIPPNFLTALPSLSPADVSLSEAIAGFSSRSFELMARDLTEENLLISPLSLYLDLAMLGEGTDGQTRAEIVSALAGSKPDRGSDFLEDSREGIAKLLGGMNISREKFVMKSGQSLWYRPDIPLRDSYTKLLEENYFTEAYIADFAGDPQAVKEKMGAWVSDKTSGLLGDDLPIRIKSSDVMYLLQTLYFKDSWLLPFSENMTEEGSFRTSDGQMKTISYMKQTILPARAYRGESYQAAELITEQGFSLRVILPDEVATLDEVLAIEDLYTVLFSDHLLNSGDDTLWEGKWQINWQLPKFDIKGDIDLKDLLAKLGIHSVMGPEADFSRAAEVTPGALFLDTAKQQVRIKVDEKGMEAAAVTILGVAESMPELQGTLDMMLDRPFLFTISTPSGLPLFMAWAGDPTAS